MTRLLPAAFGVGFLVLLAAGAVAGFLVLHDTPRGLVNAVPMPQWLRPLTQLDGLNYRIHAGLGLVFEHVGAPPDATASEWFKGAYHASSPAQMARAANGLIMVQQRSSSEQVEATLCPALHNERADGLAPRVERQAEVLAMAGLSCEQAT
ncbi:MAG TPA: hypothetical protein VGK33_09715 [Chloroflexota bacterium]|jgi:hypothetical protein